MKLTPLEIKVAETIAERLPSEMAMQYAYRPDGDGSILDLSFPNEHPDLRDKLQEEWLEMVQAVIDLVRDTPE